MSKRRHSVFTWDFGIHSIELTHPTTHLPTIRVNHGFSGIEISVHSYLKQETSHHVRMWRVSHKMTCVIKLLMVFYLLILVDYLTLGTH